MDSIVRLKCARCRTDIEPDEVNIKLAVAKCRECGSVFSFADQLPPRLEAGRQPLPRPEVPLPGGIRVESWGHELRVVRRWFTPAILFLVFFCIAWDSFLIFWYGIALTTEAPWLMVVFPVAHVAVGVGLTYYTLATLLNKTQLQVAGGVLSVTHGPVPWKGNVQLAASDIEQVFCTEKLTSSESQESRTYRVNAMLVSGRKVELMSDLTEADQALYIEQILEDHLGIVDRPVGGELARA